jgi:hypothetical protein
MAHYLPLGESFERQFLNALLPMNFPAGRGAQSPEIFC